MPRNRFAWHLFVTAAGAGVTLMIACYWLASLGLAALADEAAFQELTDTAVGLTEILPDLEDPAGREQFERLARGLTKRSRLTVEVLDREGRQVAGSAADAAAGGEPNDRWPEYEQLSATALAGRSARVSRYDVASGSRMVAVAVPIGPAAAPTGVLRVLADTQGSDRVLHAALQRLLMGFLAGGALMLLVGWMIAHRVARPLGDLARGVRQAAAGESVRLPTSAVGELAGIADAVTTLRTQLVERGLTIDRRDTEQEAVLDSMIEGVLAVDVRQRIVGINQAAASLLQVDIETVLRRPLQEVIRNPEIRRFVLQAIDCREPVEDDFVLADPVSRIFHGRGTALRDPSGEGGAVIVLNDVTELERLETVRRDFVANVSHELKTPVASIKGFVETLQDGAVDDPADARRFLEIVAKQADRLEAIIEDLLALSRIEQSEEAGSLPLETVRVAEVLASARASCLPRATERGQAIEIDCPADLTAEVNAPLLEQAVLNLIDNAIKYGGSQQPIRVQAAEDPAAAGGAGLSISVRDAGCGIAAEHLPRLFERFYRVDRGRSRQVGGTGLGLSIVKHIVQAHGGTITVVSDPGQGSTFTLTLPVAKPLRTG